MNVWDNYLAENSAIEISKVILIHPSLTEINLSLNALGDGASHIFKNVSESSPLKSLLLRACDLKENVFNELQTLGNLENMDLGQNAICDRGFERLATIVKDNKSLKKLDVSCNSLTENSAPVIIFFLKPNP